MRLAVGERIRSLRIQRGLRQSDLAFEGCTAAYISRIEAGDPDSLLAAAARARGTARGQRRLPRDGRRATACRQRSSRSPMPSSRSVSVTPQPPGTRFGSSAASSSRGRLRRGALLGLAQLTLAEGAIGEAIELLETFEALADEHTPVEAAAVEALAHAYATNGDLAAALALIERSLARTDNPLTQLSTHRRHDERADRPAPARPCRDADRRDLRRARAHAGSDLESPLSLVAVTTADGPRQQRPRCEVRAACADSDQGDRARRLRRTRASVARLHRARARTSAERPSTFSTRRFRSSDSSRIRRSSRT